MNLWHKKIQGLRKKARKTPFDARLFDRESQGESHYGGTPQERFMSGYEAAQKEAPTRTPNVRVKGWHLALGFEPGTSGRVEAPLPGKDSRWHLMAIALPYRRPIYGTDWKALGETLGFMGVPASVVEEEIEHWGAGVPFAPLRFVWPSAGGAPGDHASLLQSFYGWHADWRSRIDTLKAKAVAKTHELKPDNPFAAMALGRKLGDRVEVPISPELTGFARETVEYLDLWGWQFACSRYTSEGVVHWHASAMLIPRGRPSKQRDWSFLGEALAVLGISSPMTGYEEGGSLLTPLETHPPNSPHHWHWVEEAACG